MKLVQYKACPRCQGELNLKKDMDGECKECLQCGFSQAIQPKPRKAFDWAKTRGKPGRRRKAA